MLCTPVQGASRVHMNLPAAGHLNSWLGQVSIYCLIIAADKCWSHRCFSVHRERSFRAARVQQSPFCSGSKNKCTSPPHVASLKACTTRRQHSKRVLYL